jgi:F0F1-type ATP synthase epsilon subunit
MKLINTFVSKIKKRWNLFFNKSHFNSLDAMEIAKRFHLHDEARKLGEFGLPSFHSKSMTAIEQEVVRYIESVREQKKNKAVGDIAHIDKKIFELLSNKSEQKSEINPTEFERKALIIFNEQNAWLDKLSTAASRKISELENFRQQNNLARDAIFPDSSGLFFRYAVLMLLVILEGVFNAGFFAEGLTTGLLGGFLYAVSMASLNVLGCFILGKTAVRWAFHIKPALKFLGLSALVLAISFMVSVSLAIGHLRNAILMESKSPTQDAWVSLIHAPLGLNDLVAWILFLITIGFGIASLIDGLFLDDLYPGYGEITRRAKFASDEFEEEFEEVRSSLEDIKQDYLDAVNEEIFHSKQIAFNYKKLVEEKAAFFQNFSLSLNDSEVALYATLRIFRTENSRTRKDGLRPAYFDTLPTLRETSIERPDFDKHEQTYQQLLNELHTLEKNQPMQVDKIYTMFDKLVQQLNFMQKVPTKLNFSMLKKGFV